MIAASGSEAASASEARLRRSPLTDDLGFLLAKANAVSLSRGNEVLAAFGLKVRSYSVLALSVADIRPSQRELAAFLRLDPSQVVTLIDDLESRGLVRREIDPTDRRTKVIVATPRGEELFTSARTAAQDAEPGASRLSAQPPRCPS